MFFPLYRNLSYKSTVTSDSKWDGGSDCFIESTFNYGAESKKLFQNIAYSTCLLSNWLIKFSLCLQVIGFTAYTLPKNSTESINKQFFKKNKSLV